VKVTTDRLEQQVRFLVEIDKSKQILRQTLLVDASRQENDAEHSWHLAVMAILLSEYAGDAGLDLLRVVKMALIHDVVEIDAGDTFVYDAVGNADRREREERAAERIFSILPADLALEMRALWEEFEAQESAEARFATALDRFQPVLQNYHAGGGGWRRHSITSDRILARNEQIAAGAPALWEYARNLIQDAVRQGFIAEAPPERL
jgi:putative hydrolase of HD superfamily